MSVDHYSDVPLYAQLAAILRAWITSGELAHLDAVPSETALEQEFGVGRDSVRRAIAVLRDEGMVFTVPHRATYVGPRPLSRCCGLARNAAGLPVRRGGHGLVAAVEPGSRNYLGG